MAENGNGETKVITRIAKWIAGVILVAYVGYMFTLSLSAKMEETEQWKAIRKNELDIKALPDNCKTQEIVENALAKFELRLRKEGETLVIIKK